MEVLSAVAIRGLVCGYQCFVEHAVSIFRPELSILEHMGSNVQRNLEDHVTNICRSNISKLAKQSALLTLNLGVCILLRVLYQVQGFPSNATLFQ
jgi:hypothetical protein